MTATNPSDDRATQRVAFIALILVSFFWGTTYLGIAEARKSFPTAVLVGTRFACAGLLFLALAWYYERQIPTWRDLRRNIVVGFALLCVANGVVSWAEGLVPSGITSVILATTPFAFVGFARLAGEPIPTRAYFGLTLGFVAILVLAWPKMFDDTLAEGFWYSFFGLLISPCAWSAGSVYARARPAATGKLTNAACQNLTAGVVMTTLAVSLGDFADFHPTASGLWAWAYLVVFGSLVGYLAYIYTLAHLPAERVSIVPYANTLVAVLLGWLLNGEPLDAYIITGTALILVAVAVVNKARTAIKEPQALAPGNAETVEIDPELAPKRVA